MKAIEREAARLLVLSPEGRVLLLRLEPEHAKPHWLTPGGGLNEGETFEEAAVRELYEEVGHDDLPIGPCIWLRHIEFTWEDRRITQDERTYLIRSPDTFEPVVTHPDGEPITGTKWFDHEELRALTDTVYPEDIAILLADLLRDGPPPTPVRLRDSVD